MTCRSSGELDDVVTRLRTAGCVFAEDEAAILIEAAATPADLEPLIVRRVAGEPLEHIVGWTEFAGLRIAVGPGVFVPRRRTELLARRGIELVARDATVVDLCCGSGAVGAALLAAHPTLALYASDIDAVMTGYARRNLGDAARVFDGDLFRALPAEIAGRVDLITANAPYVPSDAIALMPPEARDHESAGSLDGGHDGLDVHRRIAAEASGWLAPGGHLLIEVGHSQAAIALTMLESVGLAAAVVRDDDLDATIVDAWLGA